MTEPMEPLLLSEREGWRVLGTRWFASRTLVGIVCVEQYDERSGSQDLVVRYYIGAATGHNEVADARAIADWGAPFPEAIGALLFGRSRS